MSYLKNVTVTNLPVTQPISAVSLPLPTGAASKAAQDDILNQLEMMRLVLTYLSDPGWLDKATNRLKGTTLIESGTVTTVGTVSSVTNIASVGGIPAQFLSIGQDFAAWSVSVGARFT